MTWFTRAVAGLCRTQFQDCFQPLEARQMLAADLVVDIDRVTSRHDWLVPGDKLSAVVVVTNEGDRTTSGEFDLVTQRWRVDGDTEYPLEELGRSRYWVSLAPGGFATFSPINITVAPDYAPGSYRIAATLEVPEDSFDPITDSDDSNNVAASSEVFDLTYRFGTYFGESSRDTRRNVRLVITQTDQADPARLETVTYSLSGPGYAEFQMPFDDSTALEDAWLEVSQSGESTSLSIAVKGGDGRITIDEDIVVNGSLRSLRAPSVNFASMDVIVGGTLGEFVAADMSHSALFIEQAGRGLKFTARTLASAAIDSRTGISALKADAWTIASETDDEFDNEDTLLAAPWINSLTITGTAQMEVSLSGAGAPSGIALKRAMVNGAASGGWSVNGGASSLTLGSTTDSFVASFAGTVSTFTINGDLRGSAAAFSFGTVNVKGSVRGASLLSGLDLGTDLALGGEGSEQDLITASIRDGLFTSLTIRGSVVDSYIAAGFYPGATDQDPGFFISGQGSVYRSLSIGDVLTNSVFYGRTFPRTVKVGSVTLTPTANPDVFITT
jgi:hypothetical protein